MYCLHLTYIPFCCGAHLNTWIIVTSWDGRSHWIFKLSIVDRWEIGRFDQNFSLRIYIAKEFSIAVPNLCVWVGSIIQAPWPSFQVGPTERHQGLMGHHILQKYQTCWMQEKITSPRAGEYSSIPFNSWFPLPVFFVIFYSNAKATAKASWQVPLKSLDYDSSMWGASLHYANECWRSSSSSLSLSYLLYFLFHCKLHS